MSFLSSIGGIFAPNTGSVDSSGDQYSFAQQQKDFIKLQFKYGVLLKRKLQAGEITQAYYDSHLWLTTQTLQSPYAGWWDEFKTAIESEDLQWLSKQVNESVTDLAKYIGTEAGAIVGGVVGGVSEGVVTGLATNLGFFGVLTIAGVAFGVYWAYKKGLLKKLPYIGPLL